MLRVVPDVPAREDFLKFGRYVHPIVAILTDPEPKTPLSIGIFGDWGSGKSTVLALIDEELRTKHKKRFLRVHFNAWLHRGEKNMLIPMLHTLQDAMNEDLGARFKGSARKLGNVLLRLGADALLKGMTADVASLDRLEDLEKKYLKEVGQVRSQMRHLREVLEKITGKVASEGAKTVLFVDNLDRCEPVEIINLLESMKLFLDVKNVFVLLAVDKTVVQRGIAIRYRKFGFKKVERRIGSDYLEKMIQIPVYLHPIDTGQIKGFVENLKPEEAVLEQVPLLERIVPRNPRKIIRILNRVALDLFTIAGMEDLRDLSPDLVTRLAVLQIWSEELYEKIGKNPKLLLCLEGIYRGKWRASEEGGWREDLAEHREAAQKIKERDSETVPLEELFRDSRFMDSEDRISKYLTMVGRLG